MSNRLELSGEEIWNSLRWAYYPEFPMENGFDPLNGTVLGFHRKIEGKNVFVSLKTAIENLEYDEKNPRRISWIIYCRLLYRGPAFEMVLDDLELKLYFDPECKNEVTFVTFTFPKRPISNNSDFRVKATLTKNRAFMFWNFLLDAEELAKEYGTPDQLEKLKRLRELKNFSVSVRGRAREMVEVDAKP